MIIALKDHSISFVRECLSKFESFTTYAQYIDQAIKHHQHINLRYNAKTGRTFTDKQGMIAWYSNSKDIPTDYSIADHIEWNLGGDILNTASMLSRGCKI